MSRLKPKQYDTNATDADRLMQMLNCGRSWYLGYSNIRWCTITQMPIGWCISKMMMSLQTISWSEIENCDGILHGLISNRIGSTVHRVSDILPLARLFILQRRWVKLTVVSNSDNNFVIPRLCLYFIDRKANTKGKPTSNLIECRVSHLQSSLKYCKRSPTR